MPTFKDIQGQERAVAQLKNDIAAEKMSHAYIFGGPMGVGKTKTAFAAAQALVCLQGTDGDACGSCRNCQLVEDGKYPGIELLQPQGATYKIEQMRKLQRTCYYSNFKGEYRVFILPEAEKMTHQAANSMLKLLEEPPPANIFIFTTTNTAAVLPTVLSRCRIVKFGALPLIVIKDKLVAKGKTDNEAEFIARMSGGSLARAIELVDSGEAFSLRQRAAELLEEIWQFRPERMSSIARLMDQEEHLEQLIANMVLLVRDYLVWYKTNDETLVVNSDRIETIKQKLLNKLSGERILVSTLAELLTLEKRLQRNTNRRLALDVMVWKIFSNGR